MPSHPRPSGTDKVFKILVEAPSSIIPKEATLGNEGRDGSY
jgi:hypothetical protein